jgi:hypothetical protein
MSDLYFFDADNGHKYGRCYSFNNYARPTKKKMVKMAKDAKEQFACNSAQGVLTQNTKFHFGGENELYVKFGVDTNIKVDIGQDPLNSVWKLNLKEETKLGDQNVETEILSQQIHSPKNTFTIKFWCDLEQTSEDGNAKSEIQNCKPQLIDTLKEKDDVHLISEDANFAQSNTSNIIDETNLIAALKDAEDTQLVRLILTALYTV